jgi:hypothetical protein
MRIAWFRATTLVGDPTDAGTWLINELRASHDIDIILERDAHDFVWQHFLQPWDLCVYELDNTRAHEFIWAYLLTYPGVVMLHSTDLAHLRVPLLTSRTVVTSNAGNADVLRARYPSAHVRVAPAGVASPTEAVRGAEGPATLAVLDSRRRGGEVVGRALDRARAGGALFERLEPAADLVPACEILIAPGWPPFHQPPTAVLAAMAAGKAVVTMEMDATAEWPAMDPQTWRPRGISVNEPPIAVTIDPRDEEHSLMVAIRRLSADASLREQLGTAAHAWWKGHATPAHAAAAWEAILEEAVGTSPPPRPDDWPKQFSEDGTELAHDILKEFGLLPRDTLARS